jgi:hypothetical protein
MVIMETCEVMYNKINEVEVCSVKQWKLCIEIND